MYTVTTVRTYVTSIHQNCNRKMFAVLFEVRDRVTFGCASLKELDQWVDALQLLLYHGRDGRGGLAKLRYQLKKYGVVIFFSGEGRGGGEVFAGAVGGGAAMVPKGPTSRHFRGKKI